MIIRRLIVYPDGCTVTAPAAAIPECCVVHGVVLYRLFSRNPVMYDDETHVDDFLGAEKVARKANAKRM